LRDYGEGAESVWGGDPDCEHTWEVKGTEKVGNNRPSEKSTLEKHGNDGRSPYLDKQTGREIEHVFCSKCGAWKGQLGLEPDYRMYIEHLVEVGRAIKRVLRPDGSWYLNLGDTYAGSGGWTSGGGQSDREDSWDRSHVDSSRGAIRPQLSASIKSKCKMLMPHRVALALIDDGWICRNDIVWYAENKMPESVKDRLSTTFEFVFHFVQRKKYWYDLDAIREPHKPSSEERANYSFEGSFTPGEAYPDEKRGRPQSWEIHEKGKNPGDLRSIATKPFPEAHFAVYPPELAEKPIKSSCPPKVCARCGKPYIRKIEKKTTFHSGSGKAENPPNGKYGKDWEQAKSGSYDIRMGPRTSIKFKGWQKTCGCETDKTKPGIVLDPMCGAGSTLVMAEKLGRRWIGIDISPKYCEMARERVRLGDREYKRRMRKRRRLRKRAEKHAKLDEFA